MRWLAALLILLPWRLSAWDGTAAELASQIRSAGLDPEECYRVRELNFTKEDLRLYLTDGYLIFGKPVDGRRHSAVFVSNAEGGDAEVLVFPPSRSERLSLARATGSPNLNEHFTLAAMIFTDDTYETLFRQIHEAGEPRQSPERGMLMEEEWSGVVRNLISSFEIRVVSDLLSSRGLSAGFFYAAITGGHLGNFDVVYDPQGREQIAIGRVALRDNRSYFDIWTSFESRSFRRGLRSFPAEEYRLSNYRLDATLQPDLTMKVTTKVTLVPVQIQNRALAFNLSPRMRLTAASINGVPAEFFQRDALRESLIRGGDAVFLLLPGFSLERGKPYELEFQHEGAVIQSAGNKVFYVGSRNNWYPNHSTQFSAFEVTFRYPKDLDLVVAGDLIEQRAEGEWNVTHRRIATPVRFLGFNLGDYEHVSLARDPYKIEVYANKQVEPALETKSQPVYVLLPRPGVGPSARKTGDLSLTMVTPQTPDPAARLRPLALEIDGAFEFMAARFGPPPVYNLTVSPIPGEYGQGFPGLVYLPTLFYLRPEERPGASQKGSQQSLDLEIMYAHEVAHQWWGNIVASASDQDAWLTEALANYSALLYVEKREGPKALDTVLAEYKRHLLAPAAEGHTVESAGPIVWGSRLISSQAPDEWQTITYEKGSWIMHMLRRRLGDERFLAMLGELAKRYRHATLTTEQFRALAAEFLPKNSVDPSLQTFFENWVYSTGVPTLRIEYSVRGKAPAIMVSGRVSQSNVEEGFTVWAPIEIRLAGGKSQTHWVQTDSEPVNFSVALKQAPLKVLLDPSDSVLAVRK